MKSAITKIPAVLIAVLIVCFALSACNIYIGGSYNTDDKTDVTEQTEIIEIEPVTVQPMTEPVTESEALDLKKYNGFICYAGESKEHKHHIDTKSGLTLYYASFNGGANQWSEKSFIVDLDSAKTDGNKLTATKITDSYGADQTSSFKELTFDFENDYVIVTVDRDENKLAGGAGQNLTDGDYVFRAP